MRKNSLIAAILLAACSSEYSPPGNTAPKTFMFDFAQGAQEWVGDFTDYPVGEDAFYELVSDYRALPPELGAQRRALFISGNNHSDDLFMYFRRRVTGLAPGRTYTARFVVEIATEAPRDCAGIGGAPGESVTLKAGAAPLEPVPVDVEGNYRLSVDKGNQAQPGAAALALGNIANSRTCEQEPRFELKSLSSGATPLTVKADSAGALWLFAGTDSGFEGTTRIYLTRFAIDLFEQNYKRRE